MPKIDMNEYNAAQAMSGGGDYDRMPAGGYVCTIKAIRTSGVDGYNRLINYPTDKQYVIAIWDIAEGDYAGHYSDEYWASPDRDWGHRFYFSWKNLGALKNTITCFEESNPSFDAMTAFKDDHWELFVGKQIGLVIGEEEYRANDGSVKKRYTLPRVKSVQDIRAGKFRVPELKKLDEPAMPTVAVDTYSDVPF